MANEQRRAEIIASGLRGLAKELGGVDELEEVLAFLDRTADALDTLAEDIGTLSDRSEVESKIRHALQTVSYVDGELDKLSAP